MPEEIASATIASSSLMNSASMAAAKEMLPKAPVEEYTQFAIKADKVVKRMVSIVPPPKDGSPLSTAIESSTVGRLVGTSESPVCTHYDVKLSGEASSKPATRAPPLNEDHLKKGSRRNDVQQARPNLHYSWRSICIHGCWDPRIRRAQ